MEKKIDFVHYFDGLYELFRVRRSGYKWEDIYKIVNSVYAPKYKFIKTCIKDGQEYEIIIVDNAPFTSGIKGDVETFKERYKEFEGFIRYIAVPQKGLSYARNGGMWNAKGEYLLFLDDDVLADYYNLEEIYSGFKYHPNVGIVGGQVILDRPFPAPKVLRKG